MKSFAQALDYRDHPQALQGLRCIHPLISQTQIDAFQQDGVVLIKGLFADFLDTISEGIEQNLAQPGPYAAENLQQSDTGRFFDDCCNW